MYIPSSFLVLIEFKAVPFLNITEHIVEERRDEMRRGTITRCGSDDNFFYTTELVLSSTNFLWLGCNVNVPVTHITSPSYPCTFG